MPQPSMPAPAAFMQPAFTADPFAAMRPVASALGMSVAPGMLPQQQHHQQLPNHLAALMQGAAALAVQSVMGGGAPVFAHGGPPGSGNAGMASAAAGGGDGGGGGGSGGGAAASAQGGEPDGSEATCIQTLGRYGTLSALWEFWADKPLVGDKPPRALEKDGSAWRKGVRKQRWSEFWGAITIIEKHAAFLTAQRDRPVSEADAAASLDRLLGECTPPKTVPHLVQKWWPAHRRLAAAERDALWGQLFQADT
jgi:hypothetical protein